MSLAYPIGQIAQWAGIQPERAANAVMATTLAVIGLVFILRPAVHGEQALRRCLWPIGAF